MCIMKVIYSQKTYLRVLLLIVVSLFSYFSMQLLSRMTQHLLLLVVLLNFISEIMYIARVQLE